MKTTFYKLLLAGLAAVGMAACSPKTMSDAEAMEYIAGYSPERISANSPIRICLTDKVRHLYPDTPLDDVLHFSPRVKGELRLTEGRTLEFVPQEGALRPGREYTCRVRMAELTQIDSLRDFAFSFAVAKRETQLRIASAQVDPNDMRYMRAEGSITFSEPVDAAQVDAALLHCDMHGTPARFTVEATEDPTVFRFTLSQLKRPETGTQVHVSFNATKLDFDAPEPQMIVVPGVEEFKLLSAERHEAAQPYIELEFSAPLATGQELEGLISIDRLDRLRIERNGTNVKLFYKRNGLTDLTLRISDLLRNRDGLSLGCEVEQHFEQEVIPPAVEIPLSGTILPDNRNLTLPFRAVNLAAVDVEVVKIYTDNVMTFLQENELDATYRLRRVGRLIYRQTVRLDKDPSLDLHAWQNFSIDLKNLFRQERGAVYNIRLSFRRAYSLYDRTEVEDFPLTSGLTEDDRKTWDTDEAWISRSAPDSNWRDYSWRESDDASKASYYMCDNRMPEYNLTASNLGLIVKRAEGDRLWTTVADLVTAAARAGVRVTAYNYQMREIGAARTDAQGFADFEVDGNPFVVTASDGISTTYLKINGGHELSTSRFNVDGKKTPQGVKGFIYGERGVWRPGDEMHLTLIVEDKQRTLPKNHPVTMELYTPSEQLYDRRTLTENVDGIYVFHMRTGEDAPTGRWDARFKVGGQTLHHPVRIETIKPNRLKIAISSPEILRATSCETIPEMLRATSCETIGLEAHWLTGPVAAGLQAKVDMALYNNPQPFERYADYVFSNPLQDFSYTKHEVFSSRLDSLGRISHKHKLSIPESAPGMLQANLIARVTEAGGDESLTSKSVRYSPYDAYVGIALGEKKFETDCDLRFPVVTVDADGNLLSGRNIEYKIYRLNWSWWWEGSASDLDRYVQSTSAEVVASDELHTVQGKAEVPFRLDYPAWGKYLVFVRDTQSGHATGGVVYIDWPDWRGHSGKSDPTAATMLSFSLDKRRYEAGESATVYLPRSAAGCVLLSVENGSRVLSRRWVQTSADRETACKVPVTREMAPNFYVHATLLQPHAQTMNDLPIRMYGIEGAEVIDRRTILHPEIEVADEIRPQQEFSIRIRERDGKPMSYTLAIVDEGLLDITAFKTPQPWQAMNQREALGVRTWDMYDEVIGAFAGRFTSILSIGGDEALRRAAGKEKRFNPVVRFLGPFTLRSGAKTHKITLPMYVGTVRVMVVAAREGCYGHADKTVAVRQLADGGFAYWPDYAEAHDWATSMVGAVMTEARRQGFPVSAQSYDRWKKYQHDAARYYRHTTDCATDLRQAYRLYTLALAGEQSTAAMNKLRESKQLSRQALLRLAAAYTVAGREEVAPQLLERADNVLPVDGDYATFWSPLRDLALEVETWALAGRADRALAQARRMASDFSATSCTTQEVAFVSAAMARLADMTGGGSCKAIICEAGKTPLDVRDIRDVKSLLLDPAKGVVTVENCSEGTLTASLLTKRRPSADETIRSSASGVTLSIRYTDLQGEPITIGRLAQGEEFLAEIEVKKDATASESMALTFAVPSGWEIWNDRLAGGAESAEAVYTDIRDDRVSWYFPLAAGQNKRFAVRLRAAYCGRFVVSPTVCEDMYDPQCRAITTNDQTAVAQ